MPASINTVSVEFIRKGPPHNQLLSPLTDYFGITGTSGAGTVSMPFEQAAFNRLIADLRYPDDVEEDQSLRQASLRTLGEHLGGVLNQVPGLPGLFSDVQDPTQVINLRFVLSAAELALLPFELAKLPSGTGKSSEEFLALSSAARVCITRKARWISNDGLCWSGVETPRVLFIVGLDITPELAARHRQALENALRPWDGEIMELSPHSKDESLRPTVQGIGAALKKGCQFVHILAHGAETQTTETVQTGLLLPGEDVDEGDASFDVLTGDRFVCLLRALPSEIDRPSCIVIASCDSAMGGDLMVPGGAFGLRVHEANIPLVVASQFPLTTASSVLLTEGFYADVFWGEHPLEVLARNRSMLYARFADTHDWASIVAYDGLPADMEEQLLSIRYSRSKACFARALRTVGQFLAPVGEGGATVEHRPSEDAVTRALEDAEKALASVPAEPRYDSECLGLRASHQKHLSELAYRQGQFQQAHAHLDKALMYYRQGARRFLAADTVQLHATFHWFHTQAVCLSCLLHGGYGAQGNDTEWHMAAYSAQVELESSEAPFWAHSTLAELWFLRLLQEQSQQIAEFEAKAKHHVKELGDLVGPEHEAATNTARQFRRYADTWLSRHFADKLELVRPTACDHAQDVALELAAVLET